MLDMAVVENDPGGIPLALGVDMHLVIVGQMHRIIDTQFLPLLEFGGGIDLLPALIVDELILGAGHVRDLEGRALHHVVEHAAVAAVGEFPIPGKLEIRKFAVRDDVAGSVAAVAGSLDTAVHDLPAVGQRRAVVVAPAGHVLTVEEELPALRLFGAGQLVVPLAGAEEGGRTGGSRKHDDDLFHILVGLDSIIQEKREVAQATLSQLLPFIG